MPLSVLHVLDSHRVGGAELAWVELVEHLDRARVAASFIAPPYPDFDPLVARAEAAGARCAGRLQVEGTFDLEGKRAFAAALRAAGPAIVHVNQNRQDSARHQIAIARRTDGPGGRQLALVSTVHDVLRKPLARISLKAWRLRRIFGALDRIACVSRAIAAEVGRFAPAAKIAVLTPFLADRLVRRAAELRADPGAKAAARARLGLPPDAPIAASVAVIAGHKGQPDLVARLGDLARRVPGFVLVLIGADPKGLVPGLEASAARQGAAGALRHAGPTEDVLGALVAADALVHAAPAEGLGRVLQEAMLLGLPCVAFRSGGVPDVVEDGVTGALAAPPDVDGLTARLVEVLLDPVRARTFGEAGRARAHERFLSGPVVGEYTRIYESLAIAPK